MKSTYPSLTEVKRLLGDSNMKSIMGLLNMKLNNLKKKIPKSAFVFQQRHIRVGKNNNLLSPRELLFCIRDILNQVMATSKSLIETFKFNIIYNSKVSEKQEKETAKAVKDYRNENWNKALKEAKWDKDKAYKLYLKYSKFI